jgi:hypothetical protein
VAVGAGRCGTQPVRRDCGWLAPGCGWPERRRRGVPGSPGASRSIGSGRRHGGAGRRAPGRRAASGRLALRRGTALPATRGVGSPSRQAAAATSASAWAYAVASPGARGQQVAQQGGRRLAPLASARMPPRRRPFAAAASAASRPAAGAQSRACGGGRIRRWRRQSSEPSARASSRGGRPAAARDGDEVQVTAARGSRRVWSSGISSDRWREPARLRGCRGQLERVGGICAGRSVRARTRQVASVSRSGKSPGRLSPGPSGGPR